MSDIAEQVRPIYGELVGYLGNAPSGTLHEYDAALWMRMHECVDELNKVTGDDYERFKVEVKTDAGSPCIVTNEYRSLLNGLIMRLHAKYFFGEQTPFSGPPASNTYMTQTATQSVTVSLVLEVQGLIDQKLLDEKMDEPERTFLQKVRSALPNIRSAVELFRLILATAKDTGISIDQVTRLFG